MEYKKALDTRKGNILLSVTDMQSLSTICEHLRKKKESEYWAKAASGLLYLMPQDAKTYSADPGCDDGVEPIW